MNAPSARRGEQISPGHAGERSGRFSRVHGIEEQHAGGIRSIRNQFEAERAAVENRHAGGTRGSRLQQPCRMHADAIIRKDRVADSYDHGI